VTTGLSGAFAFNGTNFNQIPTTHGWLERTNYGIDGGAHPIYPSVRSYEMTWNLISTSDAKQIIDFYNLVGNTGTLVSCLPKWGDAEYTFYNYSGTTLQEPQMQGYFQGYIEELRLLILNVVTNP
jgi:hypothetical protein